ncbi:DUF4964 domain-containing protein [Mucilaginibacter antarcticus]|uniref:DUF4964 domain-containing protein n=1 Tax=Mucilaginibacter antarcticus TaxID=1855725 RepID=UPI00362671A9
MKKVFRKIAMLVPGLVVAFTGMAQDKMPAYPLITHNPYFSIWSNTDKLTESATRHWTGKEQSLLGIVKVDGVNYRFMGQTSLQYKTLLASADETSYSPAYVTENPGDGWENLILPMEAGKNLLPLLVISVLLKALPGARAISGCAVNLTWHSCQPASCS